MKFRVKHLRFGLAVELNYTMQMSWDEGRKRHPDDECIWDSEKGVYLLKIKDEVWTIHPTNVTQSKWGEKIDVMAKARAAKGKGGSLKEHMERVSA